MLKALSGLYEPNLAISLKPPVKAGFGYKIIDGKATAYVCRDQMCLPPTSDVAKMLELLRLKP